MDLRHCLTRAAVDPFQNWLDALQEVHVTRRRKQASLSHEEATIQSFRKDPAFAAEYLNGVLADGDQTELLIALRRMSEAFGGIAKLAKAAGLNATTLYRTLSAQGNPELRSVIALLRAIGLQLAVKPLRRKRSAV